MIINEKEFHEVIICICFSQYSKQKWQCRPSALPYLDLDRNSANIICAQNDIISLRLHGGNAKVAFYKIMKKGLNTLNKWYRSDKI